MGASFATSPQLEAEESEGALRASGMDPDDQPLVRRAKLLLHRRLKVVTLDGRTIRGDLTCMDKSQNIILDQAVNCSINPDNGEYEEQVLGQVMIPLAQRVSCEVEVPHQMLPQVQKIVNGDD